MRNSFALLALIAIAASLISCSGNYIPHSTVAAQASSNVSLVTPSVIFRDVTCPVSSTGEGAGCVRHESKRPDGSGYYLSLRVGPERLEPNTATFMIPYPFILKRLSGWIGTGMGSQLEAQSLFQYKMPDGRSAEYALVYDKHTDVVGEKQVIFNFDQPINLPAGTVVTIMHNAGFTSTPRGWPIDSTDMIWNLYSE